MKIMVLIFIFAVSLVGMMELGIYIGFENGYQVGYAIGKDNTFNGTGYLQKSLDECVEGLFGPYNIDPV
jgi:hypothetical protein